MNIDICRFALTVALSAVVHPAAAASQASIAWAPETLTLTDGRTADVERSTLAVPEDRAKPSGRRIDLALLRMKSRAANP
ncbi:MAG: hypothetical protein ACRD15_20385, partial [Vicinamibacterales bacterium]